MIRVLTLSAAAALFFSAAERAHRRKRMHPTHDARVFRSSTGAPTLLAYRLAPRGYVAVVYRARDGARAVRVASFDDLLDVVPITSVPLAVRLPPAPTPAAALAAWHAPLREALEK